MICGWVTTEVGRQPFTVYGLMRTAQSVAPIDATAVGTSLVAFIIVYFAAFGAGTYYILRLAAIVPQVPHTSDTVDFLVAGTLPIKIAPDRVGPK